MSVLLGLNVQAAGLPQKTIDNLNVAYRGESDANHRYTLFAQKAQNRRDNCNVASRLWQLFMMVEQRLSGFR